VDFDAVEPGRQRIRRSTLEVFDDPRDFRKLQRARLGDVEIAVGGRFCLWQIIESVSATVLIAHKVCGTRRHAELDEDAPAALLHTIR
jgi:hypothetical protein